MGIFRCRVCGGILEREGQSYFCPRRHCFDIARSGYVNLLPPSAAGKRHGDDRTMVRARTALLDRGFYDPLSALICSLTVEYAPNTLTVLDVGCGEGKYSADVLHALDDAGKSATVVGIDISKEALPAAARREKRLILAAASSAALPLEDESADILLNIFSPFMGTEFRRVLKPGGRLIRAVPLEDHLWELKSLIYDRPYRNDPPSREEKGFHLTESRELRYEVTLCGEEILSLFMMTPYYYKTGRDDQEKARQAQILTTRLEFGVQIFQKTEGTV